MAREMRTGRIEPDEAQKNHNLIRAYRQSVLLKRRFATLVCLCGKGATRIPANTYGRFGSCISNLLFEQHRTFRLGQLGPFQAQFKHVLTSAKFGDGVARRVMLNWALKARLVARFCAMARTGPSSQETAAVAPLLVHILG